LSPDKHHSNRINIMSETVGFIIDRAVKSISAAKQLAATWTCQVLTPDQMQAVLWGITGNSSVTPPIIGQEEIASAAEGVHVAANGLWERQLGELHRRTVQAVGMIKNKLRDDPAAFAVVSGLSASSHSHKETLDEALALESAWDNQAPTWSPTATNTLTAFKSLRKLCAEDLRTAASDAHTAWRAEVTKLYAMANAMEQSNEAWYLDATKVFPVGTPEGDMLRSTVPTTYTPPTPPPPPAPAPTTTTATTPPPAPVPPVTATKTP
jgi:hypothetical protein